MVRSHMKIRFSSFLWIGLLLHSIAGTLPAAAHEHIFSEIIDIDPPVADGASEPSLFALEDGRILLSWTEPSGNGYAVKVAEGNTTGWSEPRTIIESDALFVNWADFPSVAAFSDGTLVAHWLKETASGYDYDLNVALSKDNGKSWGETLTPHRDGRSAQHGFATLLPIADNKMLAVWLDARAYGADTSSSNKMQLRGTVIAADGTLSEDFLLDAQTCSCCQTSAVVAGDGTILVAYRDRTEDEIRDISLVRRIEGLWSDPILVHEDGWEISGCPVNGPAIDARDTNAVVAWFTEAGDVPAVKVAFSNDTGRSFGKAVRIDQEKAVGRVDAVLLDDGSALVSWVEWNGDGEVLFVCKAEPETDCSAPQSITLNKAGGSINFPRMVQSGDGVYITWSLPGSQALIRTVFAKLNRQSE